MEAELKNLRQELAGKIGPTSDTTSSVSSLAPSRKRSGSSDKNNLATDTKSSDRDDSDQSTSGQESAHQEDEEEEVNRKEQEPFSKCKQNLEEDKNNHPTPEKRRKTRQTKS